MDGENVDKVKQILGDKSKVNEIIEKLKKDRSIMPAAMKKFNEDQVARRNLINASAAIAPSQTMGLDVPLNQRKKLAKQKATISAMAKQASLYKKGEISCIVILPNGKVSSTFYCHEEFEDDKYVIQSTIINNIPFLVIMSAMTYGKSNKLATLLLDKIICDNEKMICYGSIIFMMLDEEYISTPVTASEFKTIIENEMFSRAS